MFTGLVEEVGVIGRIERETGGARLMISAKSVLEGTKVGDSIAVSGACLTVTSVGAEGFVADCMAETLRRTTLGKLRRGATVNLERAVGLGERLGGHLVLGHVDAVGTVKAVGRVGQSVEVSISLPDSIAAYVAEKGSIAVDGVSLTVMGVDTGCFGVGLIPHTRGATTLDDAQIGDFVNLEADVIARYVARALCVTASASGDEAPVDEGLTMDLLIEKGFA